MKNKKEESKPINISDEELQRDIVNLHLPEINLVEDIDKRHKDVPFYDAQINKWLRGEMKDEDIPDYCK